MGPTVIVEKCSGDAPVVADYQADNSVTPQLRLGRFRKFSPRRETYQFLGTVHFSAPSPCMSHSNEVYYAAVLADRLLSIVAGFHPTVG